MITPRRTSLFRVPDLTAFRATLTDWVLALAPQSAGDTYLLVPTRAAGEQLRRTIEDEGLHGPRAAILWPLMGTRRDLYDEVAARLPVPPSMLSAIDREVVLAGIARALEDAGLAPPFRVRPGLVAEMVALYDQIRRLGRTVDDFERNLRSELEREQDTDRGAAALLQQTIFLTAAYRGYQVRVDETGRFDEHTLREVAIGTSSPRPLRRLIVTVADRLADAEGLWPADFDLLSRLPGLEQVDVLCTESLLGAGVLERLHAALPDLDDRASALPRHSAPRLIVPKGRMEEHDANVFVYRDREEELAGVARRLKAERAGGTPLNRTALVVRRPLPYLYLSRSVFGDAAIPFEALDTLPLAAEPYAAAVDVVLDAVANDFTRSSLLALLRSPHFALTRHTPAGGPSPDLTAPAIAALDRALADARYLGGLDRLRILVDRWRAVAGAASREQRRQLAAWPAALAALDAAEALRGLASRRLMVDQIATLIDWLRRFDRPDRGEPEASRRLRVRAAILGTLAALGSAYRQHDPDATGDAASLAAATRRWLGSQTFATLQGEPGLQIVDAQAARFGAFDDLQIVGLVEGEWPDRPRRNVLYPSSLLALLEPLPAMTDPGRGERDGVRSARAAFQDLMGSAARRVRLSTFLLEHDAVVEPSSLLDEVSGLGLTVERVDEPEIRVSSAAALALDPRQPDIVPAIASRWAHLRVLGDDRSVARFRGDAGAWRMPRVSVSRLERYLDCPFRFFASEVLRLEEQPEDEDTRTPLERGRFLHELWERFFAAWQARGHGRVAPQLLAEARSLFETLCEEALLTLSPAEAALERHRLLGSAVSPGIAHRVFAMEAARAEPIAERLLEYPLQGDFDLHLGDSVHRTVTLSAKVDRIDVLANGSLRVIDYKSRKTPDLKQALQLPIYSYVARESLQRARGGRWTIAEALYLSFEGDKPVVSLRARGRTLEELLDEAQHRMLGALDDIAAGRFPPSPAKRGLCGPCPYRAVCRLELVDRATEANGV